MTATLPATNGIVIDRPGVYQLAPDVYHSDPTPNGSLSSHGARALLPPSCPALFHHERTHPRAPRPVFDLGHAAHALVLGIGAPLDVVEHPDWRTNAAKDQRLDAYDAGAIPLLRHEYDQVAAMATALRANRDAARLLAPGRGISERSLFWVDRETGITCRAMADHITTDATGRVVVVDYKTARSASPAACASTLADYGYHQQGDWYTDGVAALNLDAGRRAAFVLIVQEKTPPYLVTCAEVDEPSLEWGRLRNRKARDIYRRCMTTGHWDGYASGIITLSLPGWTDHLYQAAWQRGDYDTEADRHDQ